MMKSIIKIFEGLYNKTKVPYEEPFLSIDYQLHNIARLKHLDTLALDLHNKTVIEFGAGIGDHTYYYLLKNCRVISTDARIELVNHIAKRFGNETMLINIETDIDKIKNLPKFDILHCYGILYHISNPEEFLRSLKGKGSLLLLETCVSSDYNIDSNYLVDEDNNNTTQAVSGIGSRPTRKWIFTLLKEVFPYVYVPKSQPDHPEFPKDWTVDFSCFRKGLFRSVFIASENELFQGSLTHILPKIYG
jgi:cyclopropane fatty-acyl-phospholipid synthase-like methyltransferase